MSYLNKKDLDNNQNAYNLSSPNPYIPDKINDEFHKDEYYNFIGNYYNINNKNNNSLPNFQEKTTEINSKNNTKKKSTEEENVLCIYIIQNQDENPVDQLNEAKNNSKIKKKEKSEKKCGRKRIRNVENQEEHNKFSDDNIRRKCKHLILKYLLKFINKQINIVYNGKIGNSIFIKELKITNQKQKFDATIRFNKLFLNKTLCEIFSEDISKKYTNLPINHNKNLINKLINEEDEFKKIYFEKLFNLTFIQCLKHIIGKEYNPLLEGLKCFNDIKNNEIIEKYEEDGEEYSKEIEYYLNNFEKIINKKRPRKLRKQI